MAERRGTSARRSHHCSLSDLVVGPRSRAAASSVVRYTAMYSMRRSWPSWTVPTPTNSTSPAGVPVSSANSRTAASRAVSPTAISPPGSSHSRPPGVVDEQHPALVLGHHQRQRQRDRGSSWSSSDSAQGRKSSSRFSLSFSASGGRWLEGTSISYHRGPIGVISTRRGSRLGVLLLVGQRADDPHLQPRLRQPLGDALAPLDDRHRVVQRGVEVQPVKPSMPPSR